MAIAIAQVKNIRTLKKYVSHVFHDGRRIPVMKWNNEIRKVMSLKEGASIPIFYNGRAADYGKLESVEFEHDFCYLSKRRISFISGYTLIVNDGKQKWNIYSLHESVVECVFNHGFLADF